MFKLTIKTDNAAFEGAECSEVARILREISQRLERGDVAGACRDINGNTVGNYGWQGRR